MTSRTRHGAAAESSTNRHDQSGEAPKEPTRNACRNPQLKDGKPSSRWKHDEADDQPNDRPDRSPRDRSEGCEPLKQKLIA